MKLYLALLLVTATLRVSKNYENGEPGLSTCSGVFVSDDEFLTARHCLRDSRGHQWVKTPQGQTYSAEIETISKESDLALLYIPNLEKHPYVKLGRPAKITEKIYTVNAGQRLENTYNEGVVCNKIEIFEDEPPMLMHNAAIMGGASGSGVFNKKGQLVGINTRASGEFSLAVDVVDIMNFLDVAGVPH